MLVVAWMALSWFACDQADTVAIDLVESESAADVPLNNVEVVEETSAPVDVVSAEETAPEEIWQSEETLQPGCLPGEGCFLDKCTENSQCESQWCVEHMGEGVCTKGCQDECPPGWNCQQVAGTDPDLVYVCVSDFANLCRPCSTGADCKGVGGTEDVCVDYGEGGSFCGGWCGNGQECPWGFSCEDVLTADGLQTMQCVADAGICPCTEKSTQLLLWTPCRRSNQWGECQGKSVCTTEGLSACDAPEPAQESCNGMDDDCDGETDEPQQVGGDYVNLCNDDNDCTKDTCNGADGCAYDILEAGECLDGDACTIGDHCEEGICAGAPVACDDDNPCTDDVCDGLGGCDFEFNQAPCDDDDPCTVADTCATGICAGYAVACDCQENADCAQLEDGDLCNGTLFCNQEKLPYQCDIAPGTTVNCPLPQGPHAACQQAVCNPEDGTCTTAPDHEGLACDDADACTIGEKCTVGQCGGGGQLNCSDDNPCTEDSCDPQSGCTHVNNTLPCQDGDACTVGDHCADGECLSGDPADCDDGNSCTQDSCAPDKGCQHETIFGQCDDQNPCTINDSCVNGLCVGGAIEDCDDDNPCTKDQCISGLGCSNVPIAGPCNDGDPCTVADQCINGECAPGDQLLCDDANPCTKDACIEGKCSFTPMPWDCDDGSQCTQTDSCIEGKCVGTDVLDCNDTNPCTTDYCDPGIGCVYSLNSLPCDDNDACTTVDKCANGECIATGELACDDDNVCTLDNCSPASGCTHVAWDGNCNDQNPCTVQDSCAEGKCVGTAILDCDDGNPCTLDLCDVAAGGCTNTPAAGFCSDNNACTINDYCEAGSCVGGPAQNCDDGNICTVDSCEANQGCTHLANDLPCDDGNVCTLDDHCADEQCTGSGETLDCEDGNICTDDSCDPATGCQHAYNNADCTDNSVCTDGDQCADGACQPGQQIQCQEDGNVCTQAACDPVQGCGQVAITPCCSNGAIEDGEECDDSNLVNDDGCDSNCQSEASCTDVGNDKLIYVSELNACLQALGAQFHNVQYIEVHYGNTEYLDNICQAMGHASYNGCHGGDQCGPGADMYPSHCNQGWLGPACHNGCGNTNYDGFYCQ